ncbi:unnamed protein product [Chironomus riparius]|uniref:Uncharacterized protein n=1 Tax=Chironomus riparius TaxID=315576 RepID=A0A9N9RX30_9DIPT|nr:unnamed protein product [Chironomus riparius]
MNINVDWTVEEIEACCDTVNGYFRFVSAKQNPNQKELYATSLYRKLIHLTSHESTTLKDWKIHGYKGFGSEVLTIYVGCPEKVRSTLTFNAIEHAPQKELRMKWNNPCTVCFAFKPTPKIVEVNQQPAGSQHLTPSTRENHEIEFVSELQIGNTPTDPIAYNHQASTSADPSFGGPFNTMTDTTGKKVLYSNRN